MANWICVYSIVAAEWPAVRENLRLRLSSPRIASGAAHPVQAAAC